MKRRLIIFGLAFYACLWALVVGVLTLGGTPFATAALGTTTSFAAAAVLAGIIVAGVLWAMRGDR